MSGRPALSSRTPGASAIAIPSARPTGTVEKISPGQIRLRDLNRAGQREHLRGNVTLISLVLHDRFPKEYLFYRVSKLEDEIFDGIEKHLEDGPGSEAYLCGPPIMIDAVTKVLIDKGMPEERILFDKF